MEDCFRVFRQRREHRCSWDYTPSYAYLRLIQGILDLKDGESMSSMKTKGYLAVLIILSSALLVSTLGKVVLALLGEYGSTAFTILDNFSSLALIPWFLVFVFYLRMQHSLVNGNTSPT